MNEWIPVEEKLPEHLQQCLVWEGRVGYIGIATFCDYGYGQYWTDDLDACHGWYTDVTHWMPAPERPKLIRGGQDGTNG